MLHNKISMKFSRNERFLLVLISTIQNRARNSNFQKRENRTFCQNIILRGYWSLELIILDENLANQSSKDIIQIIQFVELALSLRDICAKTFLHHTLPDT